MNKRNLDQFNTYEKRMQKVKEVTNTACISLYPKLNDCRYYFEGKKDGYNLYIVNALISQIDEYRAFLAESKDIEYSDIVRGNNAIDQNLKLIRKEVKDDKLAASLELNLYTQIKNSGYFKLFDRKDMAKLKAVPAVLKPVDDKRSEKKRNEAKAVDAMYSGCQNIDEKIALINALYLAQQEA